MQGEEKHNRSSGYISRLSPESLNNYFDSWQVFWLGSATTSFPSAPGEQWIMIEALDILIHEPYSYGDSAGLSPDFPFNSATAETKNRCESTEMY